MKNPLKFNKWKHIYTLDDKPITGVTTILGVINKPALVKWSANMAVDYIQEKWYHYDDEEFGIVAPGVFEEARTAFARKRDASANVGTLTHKWVEKLVEGLLGAKYGLPQVLEDMPRDEKIAHMTDKFVKWIKDNKVEFLSSEEQVYSREHWYAGTYDFMCKIDSKVYLGDLKTSSGIYDEMFFQTAAYQLAHEEMGGENVDGNLIVNCKKDGKLDWMASTEYEQNKQAFLGALAIYKRLNELKK